MRLAFLDGDFALLEELAEALVQWLDRGGFPPRTVPHSIGDAWDKWLARTTAESAIAEAKRQNASDRE